MTASTELQTFLDHHMTSRHMAEFANLVESVVMSLDPVSTRLYFDPVTVRYSLDYLTPAGHRGYIDVDARSQDSHITESDSLDGTRRFENVTDLLDVVRAQFTLTWPGTFIGDVVDAEPTCCHDWVYGQIGNDVLRECCLCHRTEDAAI